jgi:pSer/pThr/pTyr-binding forkhead associated (FHA) protein
MSRQHAVIEVVFKTDSVFAHYLKDNNSKNGTFHNGDRLDENDVIHLMPDDTIRIGHTTFKFVADV